MTGRARGGPAGPGSTGVTRIAYSPDGSTLAVEDENANTYVEHGLAQLSQSRQYSKISADGLTYPMSCGLTEGKRPWR